MRSEQGLEPTIARLQAIDASDFEYFVSDFFEEDGWDTKVTQASHDGGVDVVAERAGLFGERAVIQAKRYAPDNKVKFGEVQRYSALVRDEHRNDMAVVVTTSSFTKDAYNYAREKNVKLMDGAAIAGFVIARDLVELLDDYMPSDFEPDGAPEEVFLADETSRDDYYRDGPMEFAARVFEQKDLLDALDTIDTREIGSALVDSLDNLRAAIDNPNEAPPTGLLRKHPSLIDVTWFDVEVSDEISDTVNSSGDLSSPSGYPANTDVVCYKADGIVTVSAILPVDEPITRQHLTYAEDCVDFLLRNTDYDSTQVQGLILGNEVTCSSTPGTKLARLRSAGIEAKTYEQIITTAVRANSDLLQAVRPYFRSSQNEEMLKKLDGLASFT